MQAVGTIGCCALYTVLEYCNFRRHVSYVIPLQNTTSKMCYDEGAVS